MLRLFILLMLCVPALGQPRGIIVLDASGSMWGQIDGINKIVIARQTLRRVLGDLPEGLELGLMAYGHRSREDCADIQMLVEPRADAGEAIASAAEGINPLGRTPLTDAVRAAATELRIAEAPATVILLTDGIETCDADPCALGRELEAVGIDFTAHVVGFGLTEEEGASVACLAEETGGLYLPAENADALGEALTTTVAEVAPALGLSVPAEVAAYDPLPVLLLGPAQPGDAVVLATGAVRPAMLDTRILDAGAVRSGATQFTAPADPGPHLVAYVDRQTGQTMATAAFRVVPARVSLDAPDEVREGAAIPISADAPAAAQARVELWTTGPGAGVVASGTPVSGALTLQAFTPGAHELRLVASSGAVLARRALAVAPRPVPRALLDAPQEVDSGGDFVVRYQGPALAQGRLVIRSTGPGAAELAALSLTPGAAEGAVRLIAPEAAGVLELQLAEGDAVLASTEVAVLPTGGSLSGPAEAALAHPVPVTWSVPPLERASIRLETPDGTLIEARRLPPFATDGTEEIAAPGVPGPHVFVLTGGPRDTELARAEILATPTAGRIDAAQPVAMAAPFEATIEAPALPRRRLVILDGGRELSDVRLEPDQTEARLSAPPEPGTYTLRLVEDVRRVVLAETPLEVVEVLATLDAPEATPASERFDVAWSGPVLEVGLIQIVDAGGAQLTEARPERMTDGGTVQLVAPATPGSYSLALVDGISRTVLTTVPLTVTDSPARLDAPAEVPSSVQFEVGFDGPALPFGTIQLVDTTVAETQRDEARLDRFAASGTAMLVAPSLPGLYELRYYDATNRAVLVTEPLTVTQSPASLEAPETVTAGAPVTVVVAGPAMPRSLIRVVTHDYVETQMAELRREPFAADSEETLIAPTEPGAYSIGLVDMSNGAVIASHVLTVTDIASSVTVDSALASTPFDVAFEGPPLQRGTVRLMEPGPGRRMLTERRLDPGTERGTASLIAPAAPGTYRVELYDMIGRRVLARTDVTVAPVAAVLEDAAAGASTQVQVAWSGPAMPHGAVQLMDGDRQVTDARIERFATSGTVALTAPAAAGTYGLRLYDMTNRAVLATATLEVTEVFARLIPPAQAPASTEVEIGFEGPALRLGYIQLFQGDRRVAEARIPSDTDMGTARLVLPPEAGDYELRLFDSGNRAVLATAPLAVTAVASRVVAPIARTSEEVSIAWEGPALRLGYVQIFDGDTRVSERRVGSGPGGTVDLVAPPRPGTYEVRLLDSTNGTVLATGSITVEAVPTGLRPPPEVPMSEAFPVRFRGPALPLGYLRVMDGETRLFERRVPTADSGTVELNAPPRPGTYRVELLDNTFGEVLAEAPLTVTAVPAALEAPASAAAGETLVVRWEGPALPLGYVRLLDSSGRSVVDRRTDAAARFGEVTLTLPAATGDYVLDLQDRSGDAVLAERPLTIR